MFLNNFLYNSRIENYVSFQDNLNKILRAKVKLVKKVTKIGFWAQNGHLFSYYLVHEMYDIRDLLILARLK